MQATATNKLARSQRVRGLQSVALRYKKTTAIALLRAEYAEDANPFRKRFAAAEPRNAERGKNDPETCPRKTKAPRGSSRQDLTQPRRGAASGENQRREPAEAVADQTRTRPRARRGPRSCRWQRGRTARGA